MITLPINTAVVVPVNVAALIDDTDFKSREVAIAYNQAGMDLVWNFVTVAGVQTQTAVTPTTAGVHDWTHVGDGMYSMEIPASAGTINNNAYGYGWFTGICTGVLAWTGPIISFGNPALAPMATRSFVFQKGATSKSIYLMARDRVTGTPKTGLIYSDVTSAYYALYQAVPVAITPVTLAAITTSYASGGFVKASDANTPGLYRFDLPTGALASTDQCNVILQGANVEFSPVQIDLVDYDPVAAPDSTATLVDAIWNEIDAELTAVPAANASMRDILRFIFAKMRHKGTFNKSTGAYTLFKDDGSTALATRTDTDDGTTYTKGEDA